MQKALLYCLLAVLPCVVTGAKEWKLVPETGGEAIGPFRMLPGTQLIIDGKTYLVQPADSTPRPDVFARLKSSIIPELKVEKMDVRDLVEQLRLQSRALDPEGLGINFHVKPAPSRKIRKPDGSMITAAGEYRTLTMDLRNVSILQVLKLIEDVTGYDVGLKDDVVIITPK